MKFMDGMDIIGVAGTVQYERTLRRWTKYNLDRVYINNGKKSEGYIDLKTMSLVGSRYTWVVDIYNKVKEMEF